MVDYTIWGLGGAVATGLIVEVIKKLFPGVIEDRWAVVASIVVGLLLSTVAYLASVYGDIQTVSDVIGGGLLAALSASGLYSLVKKR